MEALELEAAGLAESSDDESMETENKPANSIESKVKDEDSEQRPVGVGVRAPPPDLDGRALTNRVARGVLDLIAKGFLLCPPLGSIVELP